MSDNIRKSTNPVVEANRDTGFVTANHRVVPITPIEFEIMWELLERPKWLVYRQQLEKICGKSLDAHLSNLRKKLPRGTIQSVRGAKGVAWMIGRVK